MQWIRITESPPDGQIRHNSRAIPRRRWMSFKLLCVFAGAFCAAGIPSFVHADPLGEAVLRAAEASIGSTVGKGESWMLVDMALQQAGADTSGIPQGQFGMSIGLGEFLPGDIVKLESVLFVGRNPNQGFAEYEKNFAHHLGVVQQFDGDEVVLVNQGQDVGGPVQLTSIWISDKKLGTISAFRPVAGGQLSKILIGKGTYPDLSQEQPTGNFGPQQGGFQGSPQGPQQGLPQGAQGGYGGNLQMQQQGYPQGGPQGNPWGQQRGFQGFTQERQGGYGGNPQGVQQGYPQGGHQGSPQGQQPGFPQGPSTGYGVPPQPMPQFQTMPLKTEIAATAEGKAVFEFVTANLYQTVGHGDSWSLVDVALRSVGADASGTPNLIFGSPVHLQNLLPGDILHLESATFAGLVSGTAESRRQDFPRLFGVVYQVNGDEVIMMAQLPENSWMVQFTIVKLHELRSGSIHAYRPQPAFRGW